MRMKLSGPFLIYADLVALPFCWFDESYGGYTCSRASALVGMESPLLPPVYQGVDLQGTHDCPDIPVVFVEVYQGVDLQGTHDLAV